MTAFWGLPVSSLGPQLTLGLGVLGSLAIGMAGGASRRQLRAYGVAALLIALALTCRARSSPVIAVDGMGPLLYLDGLGIAWQLLFYAGALPLAALLASDDEIVLSLFLGSAVGMGLLAASGNLLMLFIGLEFMSLPAYLLVARLGPSVRQCHEAALKYFFAGGAAGSLFLLGMALHYAASGSLMLSPAPGMTGQLGLALMGAAAMFKVGVFPLHFWLPDAYEASAPELAGFLSTSMKAAGILLLMRLVQIAPHGALAAALPSAGAVTMVVGALLALRQARLQRLLAYSSIAHAGYLVLGVGAWAAQGAHASGAATIYFYLATYVFMSNGAFVFLRASGLSTRSQLRGYAKRQPGLAALLAVLLLSLGGIPPTGGFLAKMLVLWDAVRAGLYGPAMAGAVAAVVSLGYYLALMRDAWLEEPDPMPNAAVESSGIEPAQRVVLLACALPVAVLGLAPWLLQGIAVFLEVGR